MNLKSLLGADIHNVQNIEEDYAWATSIGYSFVLADIFTDRNRTYDDKLTDTRTEELSSKFLNVHGKIVNGIVGKISSWIDLDNESDDFRKISEKALIEELEWASYQGFPAILIKLTKPNNVNLARVLGTYVSQEYMPFRIWIGVTMVEENDEIDDEPNNSNSSSPILWWRQFSLLLGEFISNFMVLLSLPSDIPGNNVIDDWFSEPIAALETPTHIYRTNKKGYPVLSVECQNIFKKFWKMKVQVVVSGEVKNPHGYLSYSQYLSWMWTNKPQMTIYEKHSKDMEDHLQDPLQPLADHLPNSTYSIFELDPYKYDAYERAIRLAIIDLVDKGCLRNGSDSDHPVVNSNGSCCNINGAEPLNNSGHSSSIDGELLDCKVVIVVLGAGRGPLVDSSLRAADSANYPVKIFIIEKNPNAVVLLQQRIKTDWIGRDVKVFPGDMRNVCLPLLADIFVSELLGSFGDNELSPECLDGAQKWLRPGGVSIPTSYTSYLAPLQSTKLFYEMRSQKPIRYSRKCKQTSLETPYVVRLQNCRHLAPVQPVFTFTHPKADLTDSNDRYKQLEFKINDDGVIHGFAGYFHCILYKDVTMSIHPDWHSSDMFSWFPLLFPIVKPIQVKAGTDVHMSMWRIGNNKAVWYEWACTKPEVTPIHNPGGRSYFMSLVSK